jgi:hypothetical protein
MGKPAPQRVDEWRGAAIRRLYAAGLPLLPRPCSAAGAVLRCEVVAFSGERQLPEQVASLRSLLRHAGRPTRITVVSDGTHTRRSRALLRRIDPAVRVIDLAEITPNPLPRAVRRYGAAGPMGRKLAVELALPLDGPTLYVDADVLFLPGAHAMAAELGSGEPRFLLDEEPYLDRRLDADETRPPVNGGFFLLREPLEWAEALRRLERLPPRYGFHTEQTLLHLAMHASGATALDPRRYVVATDDMRELRDRHRGREVILRHFTSPVRHKLWLAVVRHELRATPRHRP